MNTIKRGTHGVLTNTNNDSKIYCTLKDMGPSSISIHMDGDPLSRASRVFWQEDGWTFEADITLPTEIGSVIQITRWGDLKDLSSKPQWRAILTEAGWRVAVDLNYAYSPSDLMKRFTQLSEAYAFEVVL